VGRADKEKGQRLTNSVFVRWAELYNTTKSHHVTDPDLMKKKGMSLVIGQLFIKSQYMAQKLIVSLAYTLHGDEIGVNFSTDYARNNY
jgi:hypothetical protein